MRLSKDQRFTAYCIMLHELQRGEMELRTQGLCWLIGQVFMDDQDINTDEWFGSVKWFPELIKNKPDEILPWGAWFECDEEGRKERIKIVKKCIIETHP